MKTKRLPILALCLSFPVLLGGCSLKSMLQNLFHKKKDPIFYNVSFDSNGGPEIESITVEQGKLIPEPEEPTKDYYGFCYWVDENEEPWFFDEYTVSSDMTLYAVWEKFDYSKILINEICSKSRTCFVDKYEEESDWIELYNSSDRKINLFDCYISKTDDFLAGYKFENYFIEPESYLVVVASGRNIKMYEGEHHLPFTLSNKKEGSIFFTSPYKEQVSLNFPALKDDISYGRFASEYSMLKPSPGKNNETVYVEKQILPAPTFSVASGMYADEFDLEITSAEGYDIYYTIDSATPQLTSSKYETPIHIYDKSSEDDVLAKRVDITPGLDSYVPEEPIRKCMVVKAVCFDAEGNYSPVVSSSYWIGQSDFIANGVAVMSISTDFDNLFDYEKGIYCNGKIYDDWKNSQDYDPDLVDYLRPTNYTQKGFAWERQGSLTFLNHKHNLKCEQSVGMRIRGGFTRSYGKKGFNLYSRFLYDGKSKFDFKFNDKKCESIAVRCGNNPWFSATDPISSMLAKNANLNVATQDNTPTYLYLNGEYWGFYYICDKYDSKFLEETFDVEDAMMCKDMEMEEGYKTDISYFEDAIDTIGEDILTTSGYQKFTNSFDVSSFIDYLAFISYTDAFDHDLFTRNSGYWRSREKISENEYGDNRIRFMLYDNDLGLGIVDDYTHYPNAFSYIKADQKQKYLFQCQSFVEQFVTRAKEISTILSDSTNIDAATSFYSSISPLLNQNNLRWHGRENMNQDTMFDTISEFLSNRKTYFDGFVDSLVAS